MTKGKKENKESAGVRFLSFPASISESFRFARALLRACRVPHLEIRYEELLQDMRPLSEICEFLQLGPRTGPIRSNLRKLVTGTQTRLISNYAEVQDTLRGNEEVLGSVTRGLYPEFWPDDDQETAIAELTPQRLIVATEMIQVLENAWLGLNLDTYHGHPLNRGWMSVFHRWSASPDIQSIWPIIRGEFSRRFVEFCESELPLGVTYYFDDSKHPREIVRMSS